MLNASPTDKSIQTLVTHSAESTVAKLELFRCLTGYAGSKDKPTAEDVEKALNKVWSEGKIRLELQLPSPGEISGPPARLLLAMVLTAAESLHRGGTIKVRANFTITASGAGARVDDLTAQAIHGKQDLHSLSVRTIVPYFAHFLAQDLGADIRLSQPSPDVVELTLTEIQGYR